MNATTDYAELCAELYQIVGTLAVESGRMDMMGDAYDDVSRVLDELSRASEPRTWYPRKSLLPFNALPKEQKP